MKLFNRVICYLLIFFSVAASSAEEIITFINDAAWCWFQDERAVVDTVKEKLIIGTANRQSSVDVTIYDLKNKKVESSKRFGRLDYTDDHNSPGLVIGPDGKYVAMWAHHYDKYNTHYSIYDGSNWSNEKTYNWNNIPGGTDYTIAYNNVYYLSDEERMFDFSRANDRAPNFIYSEDNGNNWKYGGQLTTNKSNTYNKGYYKYWSNGIDRIDMVFTEQHPRDDTTSIYHGYFKGGKTYNTFGEVADEDVYERNNIPEFGSFTKVFAHNTVVDGDTMGRCWQSDLMRYSDGAIAILFYARANDDTLDHRNFYARLDSGETKWKISYLGRAGKGFYPSEQDYCGLGALCPDDQGRIYISSPYDPRSETSHAGKREIYRGTTTDFGTTWEWEPITENSSSDNFRPIVPQWKPGKEALLWWKGTYTSAQDFNTSVIGIISEYEVPEYKTSIQHKHRDVTISENISTIQASDQLTFMLSAANPTSITIQIFSLSGKNVARIADTRMLSGAAKFSWNTRGVARGAYCAQIRIGNRQLTQRVTVQ